MVDDPFAKLGQTDDAAYFLDMEMGEEEYEQPAAFIPYIKPADKSWVPVEIISSDLASREIRVVLQDEDGAEYVEATNKLRFDLEAQLVASCYGERSRPFLLGTPVEDVVIPYKNAAKRKSLGFKKSSGRRMLAATRSVKPGQKVTQESLKGLTDAMVGKIVLAQIRRVPKTYQDSEPRTNPDSSFVKAKVDEHGSPVRVTRDEQGNYLMKENETPFPGDPAILIPYQGDFLIPDPSDDGAVVRDSTERKVEFDNLQDDVAPVPFAILEADQVTDDIREKFTIHEHIGGKFAAERMITVTRADGSEALGQTTWDTVGLMATTPLKPGTAVQAVLDGGELVTASWLGTHWSETPQEHTLEVTEGGSVLLVPVTAGQDGLGVFAGE